MPAFLKNRKVQVIAGLVVLALVAWLIVSQLGSKPTPAPTPTVAPTTSAVVTPTVTPSQPTVAPTLATPTPAPTAATPTVAPTTAKPTTATPSTTQPVLTAKNRTPIVVTGLVPKSWVGGVDEDLGGYSYHILKEGCTIMEVGCVRDFKFGARDVISFPSELAKQSPGCKVILTASAQVKIGGLPATQRSYSITCKGEGSTSVEYEVPLANKFRFYITGGSEPSTPAGLENLLAKLKWNPAD